MPEKKYELIRDISYPGKYMRAGAQKTEAEWKELFPNLLNMGWEKEWFKDISPEPEPEELHPRAIVNRVFEQSGLRSISYKEAATEACRQYAREMLRDYAAVTADHKRLVRELDVMINGEQGAAQQASLCDIVAQMRNMNFQSSWV